MQKILRVLFLLLVILTSFATLPIHSASAFTFAAEINKRFDPPEIVAGDISTLIITIYNSNTFALENASFTDSIIGRQAGLRIASPANASSDCGGTLVAPVGGTTITFSGGTVPARTTATGTCVIRVDVTSTKVGNLINTIPAYGVAPAYGGVGLYATARGGFDVITNTTPADATLLVTEVDAPTMSKSFNPNTVFVGQYSLLSIIVHNNDPENSLTQASYTDHLPSTFKIANPATATTSGCGSPTLVATVDSTSISLSNATILPSADCVVRVRVVSGTQGTYTNTIPAGPGGIGSLQTRQGVTNSSDVSAPINVQAVRIDKTFYPTTIQQGDTSTLTLTLRNPTGAPYTNIGLVDTLPTGVTVFGTPVVNQCGGMVSSDGGSITLTGGTIPAGSPTSPGTCTVVAKVTSMAVGTHTNQILANTMTGTVTNGFPTSADLVVDTRSIGVIKSFGPNFVQGGTTSLIITLQNMASTTLTGVDFTDDMPTNVFVVGSPVLSASCGGSATVTTDGDSITVLNAVIPPGTLPDPVNNPGTCTITATVGTNVAGSFTNCINANSVTSDQAVDNDSGSCDSFTSYQIGAPAVVSKSFSPSIIAAGSSSLLRITIAAPNDTRLTGVSISDTLPGDLTIAVSPAPSTTCGGSLIAAPGIKLIQLTGGSTSSAGTSCRIDVYVTSSTSGVYRNSIPGNTLTTNEGRTDTNPRSADLNVSDFSIVKSFTPAVITPGGLSRLSIELRNTNTLSLVNVDLWDYLSSMGGNATDGVFLATDPNPTTTCGSGTVSTSGTQTIHLTGGTIPASDGVVPGLCTVDVTVTGLGVNITRTNRVVRTNVNATVEGTALTLNPVADAIADLQILDMTIVINKDFVPEDMTGGQYSTMVVKLINKYGASLSDITFTDNMPAGIILADPPAFDGGTCGGSFTILDADSFKYWGGSLPKNSDCTLTLHVGMTVTGNLTNVILAGAVTTMEGATNPEATQKSLTNLAGASISKSFAPNPVAIGETSILTITIHNDSGLNLTGMGLSDELPDGLVVASGPTENTCGGDFSPVVGSRMITLSNGSLVGNDGEEPPETIISTCSMKIPVQGGTPGSYTNTIPTGALDPVENVTNADPAIDTLVVTGYSLGNRIWDDNGAGTAGIANNGIMDGSEPGISGRTVRLYLITYEIVEEETITHETLVDTVLSDGNGYYRFDNLAAGDYLVEAQIPIGYMPSTVNGGDPDNDIDLDNNAMTVVAGYARSDTITLGGHAEPTNDHDPVINPEAGESPNVDSNRTVDFGFFKPFSLGNRVWNDNGGGAYSLINNGLRDIGEPGLAGVIVRLYQASGTDGVPTGSAQAFQVTDADGYYRFDDLVAGSYVVEVVPPVGFISSTGSTGDTDVDDNDNGAFTGAGYIRSNTIVLGPNGDEKTGETDPLANPQIDESPDAYSNRTVDFGLTQSYSLGNRVWNDNGAGTPANANNGILDSGEPGLGNVVVHLYQGTTLLDSTLTDGNGYYRFDELLVGSYSVRVELPSGYAASAVSVATPNNNVDSDNNGSTTVGNEVRSGSIDLGPDNSEPENDNDPVTNPVAGETVNAFSNRTLDFGLYASPFSLGNRVWNDNGGGNIANANNGVQDSGEPGIANATVRIYLDEDNDNSPDSTVPFATQLTNATGYYRFDNLVTGNYIVEVMVPNGFVSSTTNETDPDSNVNFNDNGVNLVGSYIRSNAITLGPTGNEPVLTADPVATPETGEAPEGYSNRTVDFGFTPLASIGDRVWLDVNQNNIQDSGDSGLTGVTVDLYTGPSGSGTFVSSAVTSGGGAYSFSNLTPGNYYLLFHLPAGGYQFSTRDVGGDDSIDSDANTSSGLTVTTTLDPGENDTSWDAGMYLPPASIGDFIWDDFYLNGVQDSGETGIWNIEVSLFRPGYGFDGIPSTADDDEPVATVSTNGTGYYHFGGLIPGNYYIQVTPPAGYKITSLNQGTDDQVDSDADRSTGATVQTTLVAGENDPSWDIGLYQVVTIGDTVWVDMDMDGIQDGGEDGLNGVAVNLYASDGTTLVASTTTTTVGGLPGKYEFTNLDPGSYIVEFLTPGGYALTTPNQGSDRSLDSNADLVTGRYATIAYNAGEMDLSIDAGFYPLASIGDWVWEDLNRDGIQDVGESGLDGFTVTLFDKDGNTVDSTTTSGGGYYSFTDLEPGEYYLEFGTEPGYAPTLKDQLSDDTVDSDVEPLSGETIHKILAPGENDTSWDAGYYILPASIGDQVWLDVNGNGIQDSSEGGINDVTVNLRDSAGTLIASGTTFNNGSVDGYYGFTQLIPGYYYLEFVIPSGYAVTLPDQGSDDDLDSDVNRTTYRTNLTLLDPDENDYSWDMGLFQSTAIGDLVWVDTNANGVQDSGENGLNNVTVDLYMTGFGQIATTTTNSSGYYQFIDLVPGDYHLDFTLPSGYQYSPRDVGVNDAVDSDVNPLNGETIITDLASNESDQTWDMGVYQYASLGNWVWRDMNADGIQSGGTETGINGIAVTLYQPGPDGNPGGGDDVLVTTTTTAGGGLYSFTNLVPGDYFVTVGKPDATYYFSPIDRGGNDAADSDADINGVMAVTTLESGENDTTWDAGEYQLAAIGDRVWLDTNGNGQQDAGETTGMSGVTVTLYDSGGTSLTTTTTDASGLYHFTDLTPAFYSVGFTLPGSYHFTLVDTGADATDSDANRTTGRTATTDLVSGENDTSWDAGMFLYAAVGDYVWVDTNGNGVQDSGEPALSGVTVNLRNSGGTQIATTTTDALGAYLFSNLDPATYSVQFANFTGYTRTVLDRGGDDTLDSDANQGTGNTANFALTSGQTDRTRDGGYYQPASIGDLVWVDTNANGIQDDGLTGLTGVTVRLYRPGFGPDGIAGNADDANIVATTTTNASGIYSFANRIPGTYTVTFVLPGGYTFSPTGQGTGSTDSNANTSTGNTGNIPLVSGDSQTTWDAGMYQKASLGDLVWTDLDADGVQDAGEPGYNGATVTLYNGSNVQVGVPVTTPASGAYSFTSLEPGNYHVEVTVPGGYLVSLQDSSSATDATDSDIDSSGVMVGTTLVSGENDLSWDAGLYQLAQIGNYAWEDLDADGSQDAGEPALSGVRVDLYRPGVGFDGIPGNADDADSIANTTTNASGGYGFGSLTPGNYNLKFTLPTGYLFSPQDAVGNTIDSDPNTATGISASTDLTSGENDDTWDAGMFRYAEVGDFVWVDTNGNGIQDSGELGLVGVTVSLYTSGGSLVSSTSTDSNGAYLFSNLTPASYYLVFGTATGYTRSAINQGGSDLLDSDGDPITGRTATFTLSSNEVNHSFDNGYYVSTSIGNLVWEDLNFNGVQDNGEPGINGVTVSLFDSANTQVGASATTAGGGLYSFTGLVPGVYHVEVTIPSGYQVTIKDNITDSIDSDIDDLGVMPSTTLVSGENDTSWDAGLYQLADIGDFAWVDSNANGTQDAGEPGLAGVTVVLYERGGTLVESVVTAADGSYLFEDLVPGIYNIVFDLPAGYNFTLNDQPPGDSTDSDVDPVLNTTPEITLISGTTQLTWDAGFYQYASIGDFVWVDTNGNGEQDAGESGLSGVTVTLLDGSGNTLKTTTTDSNGGYSFTNLVPGTYAVNFTLPTGYSFSPQYHGGDPVVDSDPDTTTGTTANITLESGDIHNVLDAGIYQPAEVGDYVWIDTNGNGILDLGEHPLEGVTVTLYTTDNVLVDSILTDEYGQYLFGGITPGEYYIVFSDQAGYSRTLQNQGVDDEADSDGNPTSGRTTNFTLISNEVNHSFDNGYYVTSSIGNFVWEDLNMNGLQDSGEPGIDGVTVSLFDADNNQVGTSVTTSGGGFYSFTGLNPGNYHIEVTIPASYLATTQGVGDNNLNSDIDATGEMPEATLVSGQTDNSWDAGLYRVAEIGDTIWLDTNANGIQDGGEIGLAGVEVTLYVGSTTTTAAPVTYTDASGNYLFTDLEPGSYHVEITVPDGYNVSPIDSSSATDATDSDANTSGVMPITTLISNETDLTWDAGLYQYASIGDFVWLDTNANGIQDAGESGLAGVSVALLNGAGTSIATATTNGTGAYGFTNLVPGTYAVQFTLPTGYTLSPQDAGGNDSVDSDPDLITNRTVSTTLNSGENDTSWDAGAYQKVEIGDRVWEDLNADGIQDPGEPGIAIITVNLICPPCIGVTTTTDSNGNYLFTDLDPGDYVVEFGLPADRVFSPADQGTDDAKDSDVISGYRTGTITLESNDSNMTVDAGMYTLASISDRVWNDLNSNGIQDGGEPGLSGITVHLYDTDGTEITTAITDSNGIYLFNNLVPGGYSLSFDLLPNYLFSPINQGGNDTVDSDVNPADGTTVETTLISNEQDTTWDAGMFLQDALIGIAKRVVGSPVELSAGTWQVTYEFLVRNYGNVPLTNVQVTDDLTATFPADVSFTVTSITSAEFTENTLFNGTTITNLLAGSDSLAVRAQGTIRVVFTVVPTSAGPYNNSAVASGQPPLGGPTSDTSQNGTTPDPDSDGDPTDNNDPTPIDFGANLFDPPFGVKEFDATGLPIIHWTMDWINDTNIVAINAAVSDPIPFGTTFYDNGISSGYPLPGTYPPNSLNTGVSCTSASQITTTQYCYFEGPTGSYPYGRIVWQGTLGPDFGVRDPEVAVNDIRIEFNVTKLNGVRVVRNIATIDADRNGDEDVLDPGEVQVATATAIWYAPKLPSTGFAPGRRTLIEEQPAAKQYYQMETMSLEIPVLGLNLPITGVPVVNNEWDLTWLGEQAGYLETTAFPTHAGNSVITGHVYLPDGKPGPFVDLNKLKYGDQIIVHAYGQKYIYEVRGTGQIAPDTKDAFPHEEYPVLSLLTCQGYDETTGTYTWRYIVRAIQVKVVEE